MAVHEQRLGEVTLGKAPRALAIAHGVGPVLLWCQHGHLGASGAPTTAQTEALQSEEVDTKLLLRAPCRVGADHLVGIILVSLIAVLWQVAGLDKEVTQAIVFTVHNIPRISGARGDLVQLWRGAAMERREDCGGELGRPNPHG